jgi:shikimate dehydrogenase
MIPTGAARLAGVIGWPVAHSRSPRLHGWWLDHYRIDGAYVPLAVPPGRIAQAIAALPALGFAGANVTVPHKEAALAAVDEADALAGRIGAVNTIAVREDSSLFGTNTDGFGFIQNLDGGAPGWPRARPAVVLGAGGSARAVIVALAEAGVPRIILCNRTRARAEALAETLDGPVEVVDWETRDRVLDGAGLLANTTTLGMAGQAPLELDLAALPGDAVVTDLVYVPLTTPLLAHAAARGLSIVDGLGMLLHQARPGFHMWFGRDPEVTPALRDFVLADLRE